MGGTAVDEIGCARDSARERMFGFLVAHGLAKPLPNGASSLHCPRASARQTGTRSSSAAQHCCSTKRISWGMPGAPSVAPRSDGQKRRESRNFRAWYRAGPGEWTRGRPVGATSPREHGPGHPGRAMGCRICSFADGGAQPRLLERRRRPQHQASATIVARAGRAPTIVKPPHLIRGRGAARQET